MIIPFRDLNGAGLKVALLDLGAKDNIAKSLAARGCDVTVYPATTTAAEILADQPDVRLIKPADFFYYNSALLRVTRTVAEHAGKLYREIYPAGNKGTCPERTAFRQRFL